MQATKRENNQQIAEMLTAKETKRQQGNTKEANRQERIEVNEWNPWVCANEKADKEEKILQKCNEQKVAREQEATSKNIRKW